MGLNALANNSQSKQRWNFKSYTSIDDAAMEALKVVNPVSISENREYCGWITYDNGLYTAGAPAKGTTDSCSLPSKPQNTAGWYHTHAAYDPSIGVGNDLFPGFKGDMGVSRYHSIPGYLATPSGMIKSYDPFTWQVRCLNPGVCYLRSWAGE